MVAVCTCVCLCVFWGGGLVVGAADLLAANGARVARAHLDRGVVGSRPCAVCNHPTALATRRGLARREVARLGPAVADALTGVAVLPFGTAVVRGPVRALLRRTARGRPVWRSLAARCAPQGFPRWLWGLWLLGAPRGQHHVWPVARWIKPTRGAVSWHSRERVEHDIASSLRSAASRESITCRCRLPGSCRSRLRTGRPCPMRNLGWPAPGWWRGCGSTGLTARWQRWPGRSRRALSVQG